MDTKTPDRWFSGESNLFDCGWFFLAVAGITFIVGLQINLVPGLPPELRLFGLVVGLLCVWKGDSMLRRLGR